MAAWQIVSGRPPSCARLTTLGIFHVSYYIHTESTPSPTYGTTGLSYRLLHAKAIPWCALLKRMLHLRPARYANSWPSATVVTARSCHALPAPALVCPSLPGQTSAPPHHRLARMTPFVRSPQHPRQVNRVHAYPPSTSPRPRSSLNTLPPGRRNTGTHHGHLSAPALLPTRMQSPRL